MLGEAVPQTEAEPLKAISEKLEVINLQLSRRQATRRRILRWLLLLLSAAIVIGFAVLWEFQSDYLTWNYQDPEAAVLGVAFHSLEWLFVRAAPVALAGAAVGLYLTRRR